MDFYPINNFELENDRNDFYRKFIRLLLSHWNSENYIGLEKETLKDKRRLSHQYISALLACGFPTDSPLVLDTYNWLIKSSDTDVGPKNENYYLVLDKIEAAIEMGKPNDAFCDDAIKLLTKPVRRIAPLKWDIPNMNPFDALDALWVTKILMNHPNRISYKKYIDEDLGVFLDGGYKSLSIRNLGFLFMLCANWWKDEFQDHPKFDEITKSIAEPSYLGFIDADSQKVRTHLKEMVNSGLTADLADGIEGPLFYSIIGTCYLIANITHIPSSIPSRNSKISNLLERSTSNIYKLLNVKIDEIKRVFPDPYKQVMLSARILVAMAQATGDNIPKRTIPGFVTDVALHDKEKEINQQLVDHENFVSAIKHHISVHWDENDFISIKGGLSGAQLVRVKPKIRFPADNADGYRQTNLAGKSSIIIKYGKKIDLDKERKNYLELPRQYRNFYPQIPVNVYNCIIQNELYEYLIIEDLKGYKTLEEILRGGELDGKEIESYFSIKLNEYLKGFYDIRLSNKKFPGFVVSELILPMIRSLGEIHSIKEQILNLDQVDEDLKNELYEFTKNSQELDKYPECIMHGDLHTRNIMVQMETNKRNPNRSNIQFILIDLDKFSRAGDVAYDIGELIANIEHCAPASSLGEKLLNEFRNYQEDRYFLTRVNLSMANSKIKIAELRLRKTTSRSVINQISEKRIQNALEELQPLVESAHKHVMLAREDFTN